VVVFAAAVFVLQAAVAQSAQLAVPLAWELAPERDVPQAVPPAEQDDQQAAQLVPCELPVAHSGVSLGDLLAVHLEPAYSSAVHLVRCALSAVRSFASRVDPLVVHSEPSVWPAGHSDVSRSDPMGGPQADCLAVRLPDGHC
jgi:hypothetical protein